MQVKYKQNNSRMCVICGMDNPFGLQAPFYVMEDDSRYSDYYTWLENVPDKMVDGDKVTVTVKGFYAMSGYLHKTPADLKAAAKPLKGVQLAWVDPATGAATPIDGAVTDENGKATFTVDGKAATGVLAAASYGDAKEEERVYALMNPSVPAKVYDGSSGELTLSGLHDAQVKYLKLYTYINGVKGDTNLLADVTIANAAYTLTLPVGDYWVEGYDANDDCNGGLSLTVKAGENAAKIQRIYQISVNSGWVLGTDYTLDVKVTSADNQVRTAELGTADSWGKVYASCIFVVGDTVQATVTPDPVTQPTFNTATAKKTPTTNDSLSISCKAGVNVTLTVPAALTKVPSGANTCISTLTLGQITSPTLIDGM